MRWNKSLIVLLPTLFIFTVLGIWLGYKLYYNTSEFINPLVKSGTQEQKELPLNKYRIDRLEHFAYQTSPLVITEKIGDYEGYTSYVFTYQATQGKISGQLNLPTARSNQDKVIVLLRGYVPVEIYETGVGSKAAAGVFAANGYITLAPDFLGYGQSDPDLADSWESRFIKPVHVIELINNIRQSDFTYIDCVYRQESNPLNEASDTTSCVKTEPNYQIGMWAHSNGGQIALSVLEVLQESIPTTLWAPVTAPFPYSVLFFSDEYQDEGKASRKWVSLFEEDYDPFGFSITQHLERLEGPIMIQHGMTDEAALVSWSLEFMDKVALENEQRESTTTVATDSSKIKKDPIDIELITYPNADHNMRPVWNSVINKDLTFFSQYL